MYQTLEVLGPEHEFSLVDEALKPLPIVDQVIKKLRGRIVNNVNLGDFTFYFSPLFLHRIALKNSVVIRFYSLTMIIY